MCFSFNIQFNSTPSTLFFASACKFPPTNDWNPIKKREEEKNFILGCCACLLPLHSGKQFLFWSGRVNAEQIAQRAPRCSVQKFIAVRAVRSHMQTFYLALCDL
jgi:hypothetical protein